MKRQAIFWFMFVASARILGEYLMLGLAKLGGENLDEEWQDELD